MRVLIDTTYARRAPLSGTGIYIERVCAELDALPGVELVQVANRRRRPPAGGGIGSLRNLAGDLWWTTVELPRLARRARAEVIHHPLPAWALTQVPQVVTVVDLAFERLPHLFDRAFRIYASRTHRAAALAARAVICISETTASDARALWGVPRQRIVVATLGAGQELSAGSPTRPQLPTHFLYVGDDELRKNLAVLLAAYELYRESTAAPLELVLAGSASASAPGIRLEPRPSPQRLRELYLDAAALVHPSRYEGFGLTPVEAMSLGTPVLAARAPGLIEVCGDAVRYADPADPSAFAAVMSELAIDAGQRERLGNRGRARAAEFSWGACARSHLDAYSLASERR